MSMALVTVDKDGSEWIHSFYPTRAKVIWFSTECIKLPKGSIKKLIGRELNWSDEPVELE
jgi:hypothetical protein